MRISDWSSDVCSSDLGADELLDLGIRWRRGAVSHCIRIATFLDSEELVGVRDLRAFSNEASGFRIRLRSEKALTQKQRSRQRQTDEQNNANNADEHVRSEEHTSELQSLMRISYAVFCLTKNNHKSRSKIHEHTT